MRMCSPMMTGLSEGGCLQKALKSLAIAQVILYLFYLLSNLSEPFYNSHSSSNMLIKKFFYFLLELKGLSSLYL